MSATDARGQRLIVFGASVDPNALAGLIGLIAAGAEVHSIGGARPDVEWLASHQSCDLDDAAVVAAAVARVGALVDTAYLVAPVHEAVRAAIERAVAALGRAGPVPIVAGISPIDVT